MSGGEAAAAWLSHGLVGTKQIGHGNGLVAMWAGATGADPPAELLAVRAALLAQEARTASWALVDRLRARHAGQEVGRP